MRGASSNLYRELVRRIVRAESPDRVILFGSRARGDQRPDSDMDVLVIKQSEAPRHHRARLLYRVLADLPVEVDVLVYTPSEVEEWSQVPLAFVTTALREGKVLYEKPRRTRAGLAPEGGQ